MYAACIRIEVNPHFREMFILATVRMAQRTLSEPGNLRYDVFQHTDDPNRFMLSEVYTDVDGMVDHKRSSHYLRWRDEVSSWCCHKSRERHEYFTVFPEASESWAS